MRPAGSFLAGLAHSVSPCGGILDDDASYETSGSALASYKPCRRSAMMRTATSTSGRAAPSASGTARAGVQAAAAFVRPISTWVLPRSLATRRATSATESPHRRGDGRRAPTQAGAATPGARARPRGAASRDRARRGWSSSAPSRRLWPSSRSGRRRRARARAEHVRRLLARGGPALEAGGRSGQVEHRVVRSGQGLPSPTTQSGGWPAIALGAPEQELELLGQEPAIARRSPAGGRHPAPLPPARLRASRRGRPCAPARPRVRARVIGAIRPERKRTASRPVNRRCGRGGRARRRSCPARRRRTRHARPDGPPARPRPRSVRPAVPAYSGRPSRPRLRRRGKSRPLIAQPSASHPPRR
jgi:hypothetical protein